ncbi:hypothetical protein HDU77_001467 [Chytriomyces hyalinus]|nr:hypothetical protein HDU77_001467 [Chytriomyces hyalinus]
MSKVENEVIAIKGTMTTVQKDITAVQMDVNAIKEMQLHLSNQVQILQNRDKKFYTRLQDIPHEIIVQVFAWIPAQTVFKYRRLSKTINEALLSTQFAVLNMYMPDFQDGSMDTIGGLWFILRHIKLPSRGHWGRKSNASSDSTHNSRCILWFDQLDESGPERQCFDGSATAFIVLLSGLINLNLTGNQLSGEFPALPNSSLETLYISRNKFTGPIPTMFGNPHKLKYLCTKNNLFNYIPAAIGQFSSLEVLSVSENPISSKIPPQIWNLRALVSLEMTSCNMFGSLAGVSALRNLRGLDVVNNQLCGSLREISDMRSLRSLHLSQNQFSACVGKWVDFTGIPELFLMCVDADIPVKGSRPCFKNHNKLTNHSDDSDSNSELESESELDTSESAGSESETRVLNLKLILWRTDWIGFFLDEQCILLILTSLIIPLQNQPNHI